MDNPPGTTQRYCQHCGSRIRTDTAYCVSCGERLLGSQEAAPQGPGASQGARRSPSAPSPGQQDITQYLVVGAIALLFVFLSVVYSLLLGVLFLLLSLLGYGLFRRSRGIQTDLEKRVFAKLPEYKGRLQRASGKATSRYKEWDQARVERLREEEKARAAERRRANATRDLGQYRSLFHRSRSGSQYFLDWWRSYAGDELKQSSPVPSHLQNLAERAASGLRRVEELESTFGSHSGEEITDSFEEDVRRELNTLRASQENFDGPHSIFVPAVAVHENIKDKPGWERFQREYEGFIQNLEDLLGSTSVRTEAANRARFPSPAESGANGPEETRCPSCGRGNLPGSNFCYSCGGPLSTNSNVASGRPQNPTAAAGISGTGFVLLSIPFAIAALFIFPPVFGGIGIFLGYRAFQGGSEGGGIAMMVVNGACLLFGMFSGMVYWGF